MTFELFTRVPFLNKVDGTGGGGGGPIEIVGP
jgi:hypothetical protein